MATVHLGMAMGSEISYKDGENMAPTHRRGFDDALQHPEVLHPPLVILSICHSQHSPIR